MPPKPRNIKAYLLVGLLVVVGAWAFLALLSAGLRHSAQTTLRGSCANNLEQIGVLFKAFADDSLGGVYPELSSQTGRLMFTPDSVYPEYLTDTNVLFCPGDDSAMQLMQSTGNQGHDQNLRIDDHSYFYLGYTVRSDAEMAAFAAAYEKHVYNGNGFVDDLPVPEGTGSAGGDVILRMRYAVARWYITEIGNAGAFPMMEASIPVLIERPENHEPAGGNVIYMDGHVEFIPYPGKWPMTEKTIGILNSLDAL